MNSKLLLSLIFILFVIVSQAQESKLEQAIYSLLEIEDFKTKANNQNDEPHRFLATKLLKLDIYDRIQVQKQILKLIVKVEAEDKDKDYWEGHPQSFWLRMVYATLLCDKQDILVSTDEFQEIEWIKYVRDNPSEMLDKSSTGEVRIEFLAYLDKNNLTRKFTGNLFSCAK